MADEDEEDEDSLQHLLLSEDEIDSLENGLTLQKDDAPQEGSSDCDECGESIPNFTGGSLANKHHKDSCSLYSPNP